MQFGGLPGPFETGTNARAKLQRRQYSRVFLMPGSGTGYLPSGPARSAYLQVTSRKTPSNQNVNNWLNKAAFAAASAGVWGNSGIDIVEAPVLQPHDLSPAKHFRLTERMNLRLQADFYNGPNVANCNGLNTTITSSAYGTISSAYPQRQIQLALKLAF
jgi:hypothetical protein